MSFLNKTNHFFQNKLLLRSTFETIILSNARLLSRIKRKKCNHADVNPLVTSFPLITNTHSLFSARLRRKGFLPSPEAPWSSARARLCSLSFSKLTKPQHLQTAAISRGNGVEIINHSLILTLSFHCCPERSSHCSRMKSDNERTHTTCHHPHPG